jgi:hypothetical protein
METTSSLAVFGIGLLVTWRLYARIKRLMTRQRSRLWRHWVAAIFFPLVLLMLGLLAMRSPVALASLAGGIAAGAGLAVWGIRLTRFESTESGYFFTPNARIGIALTALLVLRLGYRFATVGLSGMGDAAGAQVFTRSPLTLAVVGLAMGYYASYAVGLLRWRISAAAGAAATSRTPERR